MSFVYDNLSLALSVARKVEHNIRFHHCALIANKRRIISVGVNQTKTHPKTTNRYNCLHAEIDAIIGVAEKDLRGATMYVARAGGTNRETAHMSRPCGHCETAILRAGIRHVYYTINNLVAGYWDTLNDTRENWYFE